MAACMSSLLRTTPGSSSSLQEALLRLAAPVAAVAGAVRLGLSAAASPGVTMLQAAVLLVAAAAAPQANTKDGGLHGVRTTCLLVPVTALLAVPVLLLRLKAVV
jgi:hypothetical protein